MPDEPTHAKQWETLRQRAEEMLQRRATQAGGALPPDLQRALHELEVYQIELEQQNEELRRAQAELEAARDQYTDLYEFAPVGYFTLDEAGRIQAANLRGAALLGAERKRLAGQTLSRFVASQDRDAYHLYLRGLWQAEEAQVCEVDMARQDGSTFHARLEGVAVRAKGGPRGTDAGRRCRLAVSDVSRRAALEKALRDANEELELRVAERTAELELTNRQMQALAGTLAGERSILETIMEHTDTMLAYFDRDFNFVRVNAAYAHSAGFTIQELIGRNHFELYPHAENQAIFEQVRDTGKSVTFQARPFKDANQSERGTTYWDWTLAPVKDERGQVEGLVLSLRDVTERNRADAEIQMLARFPDENPNPVLRVTQDGLLLYANRASADLLACWKCSVGGRVPDTWREIVLETLDAGLLREEEADCGERIVSLVLAPIMDSAYVNIYGRDITERKQARIEREQLIRQLELERSLLRAIIENAPEGITVIDAAGRSMLSNAAADRLFTPPDIRGAQHEGAIQAIWCYPDGTPYEQRDLPLMRSAVHGETHRDVEMALVWPDGQRRELLVNIAPIHDSRGQISGAVRVFQDITQRKQAEERLAQQAEELARSNKELEQFAYVASHDLQEPLRMVASYVQLLAQRYEGQLDERADRYIGYAVDGANRMKRLIDDLLTYSRAGTHDKPLVATDSQAVLEEVLANLQVSIEEQQATVSYDALPMVLADRVQLGQLFQNLIGNALRFRSEAAPCIHVSAELETERGERRAWRFSVSDNGIGLEAKYAERIFVIFQRLHGPGEYPGTGMGLAICKKIVERHGGRIWVESQPAQGATFYFTMPGNRDLTGFPPARRREPGRAKPVRSIDQEHL